jgi:imidazolonepropionase-like amidohydrolase
MKLPEIADPDAAQLAQSYLAMGLDGIKLFTGSYKGEDKPVVNMDVAVAKAAVDVAHARGKFVFAHPQNKTGVDIVIAAGVDVMAHTAPSPGYGQYTSEQIARFKSQRIALIPTLSLFTTVVLDPNVTAQITAATVNQLRQFAENGGMVLFGTDVGFTRIYDTTLEYELMHTRCRNARCWRP